MSEKYSFWVTLRPQSDRCYRGEAEVRILNFKISRTQLTSDRSQGVRAQVTCDRDEVHSQTISTPNIQAAKDC